MDYHIGLIDSDKKGGKEEIDCQVFYSEVDLSSTLKLENNDFKGFKKDDDDD